MRVSDYLKFAAELKDIPPRDINVHLDRVLEQCDLRSVKDKMIGILSKGFKQRVGIAQAIINDPAVLILDEPMTGLDPVQVQQARSVIKTLEHRRTVIVSTHILPEIQVLAKRILIIKEGSILLDDTLENIFRSNTRRFGIHLQSHWDNCHMAIEANKSWKVIRQDQGEDMHYIEVETLTGDLNGLMNGFMKFNINILDIKEIKANLEEVFLKTAGPERGEHHE
jgi:ABC-2 type transport system ATP-binding protein